MILNINNSPDFLPILRNDIEKVVTLREFTLICVYVKVAPYVIVFIIIF